jgi:uncharacterized spore protein YtfJ
MNHANLRCLVPEVVVSTPVMSAPVPVQPIAELFERNLNIRHVYHEPVRHGDLTVIPVAKVAFGFGAGVGRRGRFGRRAQQLANGEANAPEGRVEPDGMGGGGGARMSPVGALELGPRGTRFVHYNQLPQMFGVLMIGIGIGAGLMMSGRRPNGTLRPVLNRLMKKVRFH